MRVYIIIYLAALLLALYKKETKLSLLLLLFMFFVTAFRAEEVGVDTWNYLHNFSSETGSELDFSSRALEFLNLGLYYYFLQLGIDTRVILVLYSLITYFFIFQFNKKLNTRLSYFLLFLFLTNFFIKGLNISRQVASAAILAYGILFIYEKNTSKSLWFFVFVILAGGLHATSYFYVILYVLRYIHLNNTKLVSLSTFLISLLIILNIIPIEPIMHQLMPKEFAIYSKDLAHDYTGSFLGMVLILFTLAVECILLSKYKGKYLALFALGIIMNSSTVGMDFVVSRITLFFSLVYCAFFAIYIGRQKLDQLDIALLSAMFLIKTYFAFGAILSDPDLVPFKLMTFS